MEVMQYLREEVDKKKEAVHHLEDEVEEVIEEALVGRRSRRSNDAVNGTTVEGDESSTQINVAGARCGYQIVDVSLDAEMKGAVLQQVGDDNEDKSKKSVYLDESAGALQEGSHLEKLPKVEAVSAKLKAVDAQKVLSAVISGKNVEILKDTFLSSSTLQPLTKPREEDGTTALGSIRNETEHLKIDIVDESDEEVLELEFERAVEKMHAHEYNMYCPSCSNRITKVILRRRKREKGTQPQDLLGCLSCFSIFIPKGNILDPFKIFRIGKEPESSQIRQEQKPLLAPGSAVQQQHTPGGSILNEGRGSFSTGGKPTVNGNASSSRQSSPPVNGVSQPQKPDEAFALKNGVSTVDGSTSNGSRIIDIPEKLDGTTQGTKHPMKPICEIEDEPNVTNGQYPGIQSPTECKVTFSSAPLRSFREKLQGAYVQFPPEQRPVPTEPPRIENMPDTSRPLITKEARSSNPLEVWKSIVYGGLMELITSLSIVSSAAASHATTLNIVALGLANLIGGLVVLFHNLKDLKCEESNEANGEVKSRYQELLGRKENFVLHTIFAVLSYLVFGLIPPVVYGFTFRRTDDRDFKLVAVAASSLVCIFVLATAKAYTRGQHKFMAYSKTVLYYVTGAAMASGIAYAAGHLLERFMVSLGWFDTKPVEHLLIPENKPWASF